MHTPKRALRKAPGGLGLQGPWAKAHRGLTILGAVKLLLVLFGATVFLIRQSTTLSELVGRLLMASLGPILIVILATTLGVADLVRQLLLQRAPESPLLWLLACLAASVLAYFGLRGLVRFLESRHTIRVEVWFLFIASGLTSAILPAVYYVFSAVPDTNAYLASLLFIGGLIGGVYYIADFLLSATPRSGRHQAGERLLEVVKSTFSRFDD